MSTLAPSPQVPISAADPTTRTILIVEDTPFWQKQIEQAMQSAGYTTIIACNGKEALSLLETQAPSLIISDIEMPEMTGLELMRALRGIQQWQTLPIILLTTGAAKERIIEATRLHAAEYMLKGSFSAEQLNERVKKWLSSEKSAPAAGGQKKSASAFPRLIQRNQVISEITIHVNSGKTLACVAPQVIELCPLLQKNSTPLLEIIKGDPILAMRIIQAANALKRVGTIEEAVRVIGADGILAIAKSLTAYPPTTRSALPTWQHAMCVASVMHKIVPRSFEIGVGVAYLVGLLHDLPEIIFRQAFPSQYEALIDFAGQGGKAARQIMPDVCSVSLVDVADELITQLKLPPVIAIPFREFAAATPGDDAGRSGPMSDRLTMALRFSEYYANALQLTAAPAEAFIAPLTIAECRAAYISTTPLNGAEIRSHVLALSEKLNGPATSQQSSGGKSKPKLWYTRHNSYSELDPIEAALRVVANVEVHSEPPNKQEHFANFNGIVICAPSADAFGVLWSLANRASEKTSDSHLGILNIIPATSAPKNPPDQNTHILRYPFSLAALKQTLQPILG